METIVAGLLEDAEGRNHRRPGRSRDQERPEGKARRRPEERDREIAAASECPVHLEGYHLTPPEGGDQLDGHHRIPQAYDPDGVRRVRVENGRDPRVDLGRHHDMDPMPEQREEAARQRPVAQVRGDRHAPASACQRRPRRGLVVGSRHVAPQPGLRVPG